MRLRLAAAVATALLLPPAAAADTADWTRTPVLMVHGWFVLGDAGTATWATFRKRLIEDGWPAEYVHTPSFRDVRGCDPEHANEIAAWVDELLAATKADRVDIVAHSAGALNSMYFLRNLCGVHKVRNLVALAGAFHGTVVACMDVFQNCGSVEMCIDSKPGGWQSNPQIVALTKGDETPGDVLYTSVWSTYDEIIVPPSGSVLAGARNIEVETDWVEHGGIFLCDECYDHVKQALLEGTGLNQDGPGWEHLPAECAPSVPEPEPEPEAAPDLPEPPPESKPEWAPDAASEVTADTATPDAVHVTDAAPPHEPDPHPPTRLPSMGGCSAGGGSGAAAVATVLLPGIATTRRRRTS
ncbi:MAG: hypothetical protein FJ087_05230 [Deltaproteobacteria bacterium]|nr:hypothetical protein [Deltaproteobacteria bacterium]